MDCEKCDELRGRAQKLREVLFDLVSVLGVRELENVLRTIVKEALKDENNMSIAHWEAFELLGFNTDNEE